MDNELNVEEVRTAAARLGYKEWYFSDMFIPMVAFAKDLDDSNDKSDRVCVKIQVYLRSRVVSACVFDRMGDDQGGCHERNAHDEEYDHHFSCNKKTIFLLQDVTLDSVEHVLSSPLGYAKERGFTRRHVMKDEWSPPATPGFDSSCANCGKTKGSGENEVDTLHACSRCKSVCYCGRKCQRTHWKKEHQSKCFKRSECDAVRRWYHTAVSSGLTDDAQEVEQIAEFCKLFDHLLFEPGGPPSLCRGRYGCGAICSLSNLLLDVGREYHDVIGFCSVSDAMDRLSEESDSISNYNAHFPACYNHDEFMEEFKEEVNRLHNLLLSLRPELQAEMLMWEFERIHCHSGLCMINSDEMPLVVVKRTFAVHLSNMHYSRLVFGDDGDKIVCQMHGTFETRHHDDHDHDPGESDDETTATTDDEQLSEDEDQDE